MRTRFAFAAMAVALAIGAAAWWLATEGNSSRTTTPASTDKPTHALTEQQAEASPSTIPAQASAPVSPTASQAAAIRLLVTDEAHSPIAGAVIYPCSPRGRRVAFAREHSVVLGTTGPDGKVEIAAGSGVRRSEGTVLVAFASGYRPKALEEEPRPGELTVVTLQSADSLRVRCVDTSGAPVAGLAIAVSRTSLVSIDEETESRRSVLPGPNDATAIFHSMTDGEGVAEFLSLSPGKYASVLGPSRHAFVETSDAWTVPGPECRIVLAPMWAAVVRVEGDEPLWGGFSYSSFNHRGSSRTARDTDRCQAALELKHPGTKVLVMAAPADAAPKATFRANLRWGGIVSRPIELRSLDAPEIIQVLRFEHPDGAEDLTRECIFTVVDGSGRPMSVRNFALVPGEASPTGQTSPFDLDSLPIVVGAPSRIPIGYYSIQALGSLLPGGFSPTEIEVRDEPLQRFTIQFDRDARKCRFVLKSEDDLGYVNAFVTIVPPVGKKTSIFFGDVAKWSGWFPVGNTTFSAEGLGFRIAPQTIRIEAAPDDSEQLIELVATRTN